MISSTLSATNDGQAQARERATGAAYTAIYGCGMDPFEHPEGWEYAGTVADAVLASLAPDNRVEPAHSMPMGFCVRCNRFAPIAEKGVCDGCVRRGAALEASSRQEERLREALDAEDAYWAASRVLAASLPRLREGARIAFETAEARRTAARAALEPPHAKDAADV